MHILHICSHKRSLPSSAIFRPAIYGALKSRSDSQFESDRTIYVIENIGLIILKRPLTPCQESDRKPAWCLQFNAFLLLHTYCLTSWNNSSTRISWTEWN